MSAQREVVVTSIASIEDFHVIPLSSLPILDRIQSKLNRENVLWEENEEGWEEDILYKSARESDSLVLAPCALPSPILGRAIILVRTLELDTVRFVDTGDVATLQRNRIKPLPWPNLQNRPGLAIRCSLFSCRAWGEETTKVFTSLVSGHVWELEVIGAEEGVLQVDLCRELDGKMTSVRDSLVFSDGAKFAFTGTKVVSLPDMEALTYLRAPPLRRRKRYTAITSHIDSKGLHVQILSGKARKVTLTLPSLMEELSAFYGIKYNEELFGLPLPPRPGVAAVIKDKEDKMWYRVQVEKLVRGRIFLVTYVDFGNKEFVSSHRLRRIKPQFLDLPCVAQPIDIKGWDGSGLPYTILRDTLGYSELQIKVSSIEGKVKIKLDGENLKFRSCNFRNKS